MNVHIGKEIKKVLQERGFKQTTLAEKISTTRQNIRRILLSKSIDSDQLLKISKVLDYNFFQHYYPYSENKHEIVVQIKINDPSKENQILKLALGKELLDAFHDKNEKS